ncbi:aspartyl/glutamyl-tRNA(Asn/Gln) amidotransferase subunit B [Firmicutes bacterium CAG:460]|jgi:aspartyl/glutamyl-tRNA(asn/gln) amidotransferase, B subunit|nr:Asp-tRNA(Asn)/Glu-tRNA(Gln) amidotransferase subunit GatB [Bacillota bacterium]CDE50974.1 aspartyl/glutamyl-tRNA(Asn/Gln) amidotransferase subunit B [Firmicutes bacterium CAG:460]
MSKYKAVIGLEMHCEMKSNTKVFSSAKNSYSDIANINVNPVDMAFPGILPVLNKECVRKAIMAALILNCKVPEYMYFDRKNYYYPDLPKGYQITQLHDPVGVNGSIKIDCNGVTKEIKIHDIHLEEDAASMEHFSDVSLINYNRAGVPLLELVTEPCIESPEEAVAFLEEMRRIYQYADISEADTKKGQIRCDVNVSIMDKDSNELGTKVEVKNVNSFGNVYETIKYEIERQSKLKDEGRYDEVVQETRRFDEETGTTIRMRTKADAIDYKYFVEPNIPKFKIDSNLVEEIKKCIPVLPNERKIKYINEYGLSEYDANIIIKNKEYADYFEECVSLGMDKKIVANYLIVQIIAYLNKEAISLNEFYLKPNLLNQIISELEKGNISSKQAKDIFNKALEEEKEPKNFISKDNAQISDSNELTIIIDNILKNNTSQVEAYKGGKTNLFDYFVGQVMKETRGKANPSLTKEILKDKLDN